MVIGSLRILFHYLLKTAHEVEPRIAPVVQKKCSFSKSCSSWPTVAQHPRVEAGVSGSPLWAGLLAFHCAGCSGQSWGLWVHFTKWQVPVLHSKEPPGSQPWERIPQEKAGGSTVPGGILSV